MKPNTRLVWKICILFIIFSPFLLSTAKSNQSEEKYHREAEVRLSTTIKQIQQQPITLKSQIELSHTYFFLANISLSEAKSLKLHQDGITLAEQALKSAPDNESALLWWIVNTLGVLKIQKPFSALWRLPNLEKQLIALKNRNEDFEYAAADRVLAKIYAESPFWLLGSTTQAHEHFKEALRLAPNFPANKILYAEFLVDQGKLEYARELLSEVESKDRLSAFPVYELIWKMDLYRIRKKICLLKNKDTHIFCR